MLLRALILLAAFALAFGSVDPARGQTRGAIGGSSSERGGLWVPPRADRPRILLPRQAAESQLIRGSRPIGFTPNRTPATPLGRAPLTPARTAVIQTSQLRDVARGRVLTANESLQRTVTRAAASEQEILRHADAVTEAARTEDAAASREQEARVRLEVAERPARGPLGFGARTAPSDEPAAQRGPIGFVPPSTRAEDPNAPARRGPLGFTATSRATDDPRARLLPRRTAGFVQGTVPLPRGSELEARIATVTRAESRLETASAALRQSTARVTSARVERQRLLSLRPVNQRDLRANMHRLERADREVSAAEEEHRGVRRQVGEASAELARAREALGDPPASRNAPIGFRPDN
jgi:hypothetical protein